VRATGQSDEPEGLLPKRIHQASNFRNYCIQQTDDWDYPKQIQEEWDKIQNKFTESKLKRISTQNISMTDETSNGQEQVTFHLN